MNVLLFSRYETLGASSRVRFYQYLPYLESKGVHVHIQPFFRDEYLRSFYSNNGKPLNEVVAAYARRIYSLLTKKNFDLVWLEYEALPWLPDFFEKLLCVRRVPLVVDYDDAIFHRYDKHSNVLVRWLLGPKIRNLMRRADLVVVGNNYIRKYAIQAGAVRVEILPSVVDMRRYEYVQNPIRNSEVVIGWIGSPATAHNLRLVATVTKEIAETKNVKFLAIGANPSQLTGMPIDAIPWSEESEVEKIQSLDVGIMPIPDEPFERGKCGYKLIQYMACGKPVVASRVGANLEIVHEAKDGFLATSHAEWIQSLNKLIQNHELRITMGRAALNNVRQNYSLEGAAPKLEQLLRSVING